MKGKTGRLPGQKLVVRRNGTSPESIMRRLGFLLAGLSGLILLFHPGCTGCKKDHSGMFRGQCGLEGQWVECMWEEDCYDRDCGSGRCNWCTLDGTCTRAESTCYLTGRRCMNTLVCVSMHCYSACNTHADCEPGRYCECLWPAVFHSSTPAAGFCWTLRCHPDSSLCPDGSEPVPGSRACNQLIREADCHWAPPFPGCPPGYEPEGEQGCRMVEPYAWRYRDAGTPDGAAPEAGPPDAGPPDGAAPDAGVEDGGS
jgi:hypothetical protein